MTKIILSLTGLAQYARGISAVGDEHICIGNFKPLCTHPNACLETLDP